MFVTLSMTVPLIGVLGLEDSPLGEEGGCEVPTVAVVGRGGGRLLLLYSLTSSLSEPLSTTFGGCKELVELLLDGG